MSRLVLAAAVALAGCPTPKQGPPPTLADPTPGVSRDERADRIAELQDEILTSYERDEPLESENGMLIPEVGPARIGVAPEDVLLAGELMKPQTRWPLSLDKWTRSDGRSKRLDIHLALDQSAAWVSDEISWQIVMCGRTAMIPLRMTALFSRDGDRWVPVFEHVSFGRTPTPTRTGQKPPRPIFPAVASRDLADELSRVLSPIVRREITTASPIATGPEVTLLGPDVAAEWHGADVLGAKLVPGTAPMKLEDRRVGVVGRGLGKSSIAYWIGNITTELPARPGVPGGLAHFRGTFVFEKRGKGDDARWVLVQGHISHAIEDGELASAVFGTALLSPEPLAITCSDGSRK